MRQEEEIMKKRIAKLEEALDAMVLKKGQMTMGQAVDEAIRRHESTFVDSHAYQAKVEPANGFWRVELTTSASECSGQSVYFLKK